MKHLEYETLALVESRHWWYRTLHEMTLVEILNHISSKDKRGSILLFDAGCGTGGLLQYIKHRISEISLSGCEPYPWAYNKCLEKGFSNVQNSTVVNIEGLPLVDVITCMDVLYHQNVEPLQALRKLRTKIKPDGLLILNVAALSSLSRQHDVNVMGARRFNKKEIISLASQAGFTVREARYWNSLLVPVLYAQIFLEKVLSAFNHTFCVRNMGTQKKSDLAQLGRFTNLLIYKILKFESGISSFIRLPFGSSIFMVASPSK